MKKLVKSIFKRHKQVLIYGDYKCHTGFSTVVTNILNGFRDSLGDNIHFTVIAINWYGDLLPSDYEIKKEEAAEIKIIEEFDGKEVVKVKRRIKKTEGNITSYSAYYNDGREDVFGRNVLMTFLNFYEYDAVFMVQDLGVVAPILPAFEKYHAEKKAQNKKQWKTMFYFPVDGPVLKRWTTDLHIVDKLVAYTEFARESILEFRPELKISVIPHGVNTNIFKTAEYGEVEEFRRAYFGDNSRKRIISNINRNQLRKDIPTTVFAFKAYKEKYNQNSFLYLHMNPEDPQGWNLHTFMEQTGLVQNEDYMFTPPALIKQPPEPGFLNMIYNASDLYLTTTTGEGFGLTIIEAMAAGCPVVAPNNTSIPEINGPNRDRIWTVNEFIPYVSAFDNMIRAGCDYNEVADKIQHTQLVQELVEIFKKNSLLYAQSLDWSNVCRRWNDEMKKLL